MQDFLHGITFPVVQDDIDLLDLKNCLYLAVTMQVWTPHAPAALTVQDTPISMSDRFEKIEEENSMVFV